MEEKKDALQRREHKPLLQVDPDEVERTAIQFARSSFVPQSYKGKWVGQGQGRRFQEYPQDLIIANTYGAIVYGNEIGLSVVQALQNIAVINGRPSIWGDAIPGLVYASKLPEYINEWIEGEGDKMEAFCETLRKGEPKAHKVGFSVADAKKAGLWTKPGPWQNTPKRMLQLRARAFCLRDKYPDVLKGLISREEAEDLPYTDYEVVETEPAPTLEESLENRAAVLEQQQEEETTGNSRKLEDTTPEEPEDSVDSPAPEGAGGDTPKQEATSARILDAFADHNVDRALVDKLCTNVFGGQTSYANIARSKEKKEQLMSVALMISNYFQEKDWRPILEFVHDNQMLLKSERHVQKAVEEFSRMLGATADA